MEEMKIRLTKADDVREFVRAARKCEFDVDISYERAVVDHPLTVSCHGESQEFRQSMQRFAVEA